MSRLWLLALILLQGCAGVLAGRGALRDSDPTWLPWKSLLDGDVPKAAQVFTETLRRHPDDLLARFGRGSVAFEHGADVAAIEDYLALAETVARGGANATWGPALATAALARISVLWGNLADSRPFEERILTLRGDSLPWQARFVLAALADSIARRRGDVTLLAGQARGRGCVVGADLLATVGRLPHLDLETAVAPKAPPIRKLLASGCRLTLPALDAHGGVRVVRAEVTVAAGEHEIVLDFTGVALLRADDGPWLHHGSATATGPRWSVLRVQLAAGRHVLEIHLGSFGGAAEFGLLVSRGSGPSDGLPGKAGAIPRAVADLTGLLVSDLTGDWDSALTLADRLVEQRRFSLGLAASAAVIARDATRPAAVARDQARALYRRALGLDPQMARVWRELAVADLANDRPREAAENAERALRASPDWWPAALLLSDAHRERGLERDADRVLDRLVALGQNAPGPCPVWEAAYRRARQRDRVSDEENLARRVGACDAQSDVPGEFSRQRGDLGATQAAIERRLVLATDAVPLRTDLAAIKLARGMGQAALRDLEDLVRVAPRDVALRLRLVDALASTGESAGARAVVAHALHDFPTRPELRQAARPFGVPLPLDAHRVDGRAIIRAFIQSGRTYQAPSVLVLDRTVSRTFDDGAQMILTHNIVRVQSKDGIGRWGEITVPPGAEVLILRTHKPDGTFREPEEIIGKDSISAPDLAVGDFIEWETLDLREPHDAFAPGFLGDRFYFQSVEAPLDRSEYLLITPRQLALDFDRRAGAPVGVLTPGQDNTVLTTFAAHAVPQLFAEPSAVPAVEWIPSVRVSSGANLARWTRFVSDQMFGVTRGSPALRRLARTIAAGVAPDPSGQAFLPDAQMAAIVRWVTDHIEAERDLLEPATTTLARGRGNRAALIVALAQVLGLAPQLALARPVSVAAADAPVIGQELDDFSEVLIRFASTSGRTVFIDPRWRRAAYGYLPPAIDGAATFVIGAHDVEHAVNVQPDHRSVAMSVRVGAQGEGDASVTETLTGWPSVEWAEILDSVGNDRHKLRQDFEQRWLGQNFPGAELQELEIEPGAAGETRLHYTFTDPHFAAREGSEFKLAPRFFRAEPGRRFASEQSRRTGLLVGADIPLDLDARIALPPGARVVDAGASGTVTAGSLRFVEGRDVGHGAAPTISLRRQTRLPIFRVPPALYDGVAASLRKVDPLEEAEIRFVMPARGDR